MSRRLARRIADYDRPGSIGFRLRQRRAGPLLELLREEHARAGAVRVLDIGGTPAYWNIIPRETLERLQVRITLANLYRVETGSRPAPFTAVEADGCDLSRFGDGEFDVAHSNSVLEHVGGWDRMQRFASETRRVARRHFVQTPYFWFPVEPHSMVPFFHWLPRPVRIGLVRRFSLGHWDRCRDHPSAVRLLEENQLLDKRRFRQLFPDSNLVFERLCGLPKSMLAIR